MASARPSEAKQGGGFLNNVDGKIVDYQFTDEFPGAGDRPAKKKSDFNPLYFVLTVKLDGADDKETTTLFVGSADDFEIEDDGKTLTPVDDNAGIRATSEVNMFIASMVSGGLDENELPADQINYEAIIGYRVRFVQVQKIDNKTGKPRTRIAKKGKFKGKEFPDTMTQVSTVYGKDETKGGRKSAQEAPRTTKVAGKGKGKDAEPEIDVEARDAADAALIKVLEKAPKNQVARALLAAKAGTVAKSDDVRRMVFDEGYLADAEERGLITYDAKGKAQLVTLAGGDE